MRGESVNECIFGGGGGMDAWVEEGLGKAGAYPAQGTCTPWDFCLSVSTITTETMICGFSSE